MKPKLALIGTFITLVACLTAQYKLVGVRESGPGEVSFEIAASKFTNAIIELGFTSPDVEESKCRIIRIDSYALYDLRTKRGDWSGRVDTVSGRITSLYNDKRRIEQYRGIGRTGAQFFTSEQAAKNHLRMIATKIGMPPEAVFSKLTWKRDGEVKDAITSGTVYANYRIPGRETFVVEVDPQDGMFISYRHAVRR